MDVNLARIDQKVIKRFWNFVYPDPNSGCFIWAGSCNEHGYGQISIVSTKNNKPYPFKAHRISWILDGRQLGSHEKLLHKCDTPCCINPEHLYVGTQQENSIDMAKRGRGRKSRFLYGARYDERRQRWWAGMAVNGKSMFLGYFDSEYDAHSAAMRKKKEIYGVDFGGAINA